MLLGDNVFNNRTFRQAESFLSGHKYKQPFYFAVDQKSSLTTSKSYGCIDLQTFLKEYFYLEDTSKIIYEQLKYDRKMSEVYDIDLKITNTSTYKNSEDVFKEFNQLYSDFSNHYKLDSPEFYITDSSNSEKISLHILNKKRCFLNFTDSEHFYNVFYIFIKKDISLYPISEYIDFSIYSRNRCMRIIYSSKEGQNRPLLPPSWHKPSYDSKDDISKFLITSCNYEDIESFKLPDNFRTDNVIFRRKTIKTTDVSPDICKYNIKKLQSNKIKTTFIIPDNSFLPETLINEVNKCLFNLPLEYIEDYNLWRNLVFCLCKLKVSFDDIQNISKKSNKYDLTSLQTLVNSYREDKCNMSLSTLQSWTISKDEIDIATEYGNIHKRKLTSWQINELSNVKSYKAICLIPKNKRTEEQKKIVLDSISLATKQAIDRLFKIKINDLSTDKFVSYEPYHLSKYSGVKAGLGKGKSTSVSTYINITQPKSIIVISPRQIFASNFTNLLNKKMSSPNIHFQCYLDSLGSIKHNYNVIQIESLHRLFSTSPELLIIDEVESVLNQMSSVETNGSNHIKNYNNFVALLKHSKKVIFMDAFLSNRTINFFNDIGIDLNDYIQTKHRHIQIIEYTTPLVRRTYKEKKDIYTFTSSLVNDLKNNKKIYLFCSSKKKLRSLILPSILNDLPNIKILPIYSGSENHNETKNVNELWSDYNLIATTSKMTVGINYDTPNIFDSIYVYMNAMSKNLVRDAFQSSYRVRHLISDKMVFCLDSRIYGKRLETNYEQIKINEYVKQIATRDKFESLGETFYETPQPLINLNVFNIYERNISFMYLKEVFYKYLEVCNYHPDNSETEIQDDEYDTFIINTYIPYEDVLLIEYDDVVNIQNNRKTTDIEKLQASKFFFNKMIKKDVIDNKQIIEHLWSLYCGSDKNKFRNLSKEKQGISYFNENGFSTLSNNNLLKQDILNNIVDKLGLEYSQNYGYVVERQFMTDILPWLDDNRQKIKTIFDIRDQSKTKRFDIKAGADMINKVLASWGFSCLKVEKQVNKKVSGKAVNISPFTLVKKNKDLILEDDELIKIDIWDSLYKRDI